MSFPYTVYGKPGDAYETSSTKRFPLGTRMIMKDGRAYRYCKNGTTILYAGKLCRMGDTVDNSTFAYTMSTNVEIGSTSVKLNTTGATGPFAKNVLDDGYLFYNATGATGGGELHLIYRVGSSGSTDAAVTGGDPSVDGTFGTATGYRATIHLYPNDYIRNAWTTSTGEVHVVPNKYMAVQPTDIAVGAGGAVVGVPNIAIPASYFFWAQTWGPCPLERKDGATDHDVAGVEVYHATEAATTGMVSVRLSATGQLLMAMGPSVGTLMTLGTSTFKNLIDLHISP